MKELPKTYNPKKIEDKIYQKWEKSGLFNPDNLEKSSDRFWNAETYSIAMPPPNVTGVLHLGHALENALMDTQIRYQRMTGKKALLIPGTDHAAIATQNVVERKIWESEKKTRHDLGREELLKRINEFISHTMGRIEAQIRKMGSSADWSREKYTLSPELSLAVRTVFKQMYDAGLIYRGERIVNWCPRCGTTLADDEVEYVETLGHLYFIHYPFPKNKGGLTIATTRPETMLGDTAVAVNPKDERYKKYVGKTVMLPLVNRELPVIADDAVTMDFGTGALKITPGHDPVDFGIGKRHELEIINLFTQEGKIDDKEAYDHGFEDYSNLTAQEAREKIIEDLKTQDFLEKTEELKHNIGHCYRCNTVIEPIVSKQWFVSVDVKFKGKDGKETTLKETAIAVVKSGAVKIIPERFTKIFLNWMEKLRDWNISRQIWFGHQVPVWYCRDCDQTTVEVNTPTSCPSCQSINIIQDEDTLDTWFSSSLWTFSTLGWPNETDDLKRFHPTSWMQMGYEILTLWMSRMIYMSTFALGQVPFKEVYFHGMLRNKEGKKFSKSSKVGIDPLEIIEKYGTDALRLSVLAGITPGNDSRFYEEKIEHYKNFVNKLWNISKFILANSPEVKKEIPDAHTIADEWILGRLAELVGQIHAHMEKYEFSQSVEKLYEFTWHNFADWYLEIAKMTLQRHPREGQVPKFRISEFGWQGGDPALTQAILSHVLQNLLKLWHPFIPFITEHIWSQFSDELLLVQEYPTVNSKIVSRGGQKSESLEQFEKIQKLITNLRNLRAEYRQPPAKILAAYLQIPKNLEWVKAETDIIEKLARVKINQEKMPEGKKMPYVIWEELKIFLIIPHFDPKKEITLAEKKLKEISVFSANLEKQLTKKDFIKKAPVEVVQKIKNGYESASQQIQKLKDKIKALKS